MIALVLLLLSADYGDIQARVIRVIDGDSILVCIDSYPPIVREIEVRIAGIDTPELRDKRQSIREIAVAAHARTIDLVGGRLVMLKSMTRDKYFRINAGVFVGEVDVGRELLKAKLARPYNGKVSRPW